MINASVVGASGYSGVFLLFALSLRNDVQISNITSNSYAGKKLCSVYPSFSGRKSINGFSDLVFERYNEAAISSTSDVVFFCLPHGESSKHVPGLLKRNASLKIIDIGADYRFDDLEIYKKYYSEHNSAELNQDFTYGLSDIFHEKIKSSQLVANPGCYPTGALLPLLPLLYSNLVDASIPVIIDSLSGISGAGRGLKLQNLFCEVNNSVKAYNIWSHRHLPEISEKARNAFFEGSREDGEGPETIEILFTPHIIPTARGILTTSYFKLKYGILEEDIFSAYNSYYDGNPFVSILEDPSMVDIRNVAYSNNCHIAFEKGMDAGNERYVKVISAIDNLGKGASLQAVQNMNLMFGLTPETGINSYSPFP